MTRSLLDAPRALPLRPSGSAGELGRIVVLAPHPDDESLGCGGLLALAQDAGTDPHVVVVTDGRASHPGSHTHPPDVLAALREAEARRAVAALGLPPAALTFLRLPDCGVPRDYEPGFDAQVDRLRALLAPLQPDTLLVPWRGDPHRDHEAVWMLSRAAAPSLPSRPRWIEYPVWARVHPQCGPGPDSARAWRLDIAGVLACKRRAIAAHRSQTGGLITDSPEGFSLTADVQALFDAPFEVFIEPADVF